MQKPIELVCLHNLNHCLSQLIFSLLFNDATTAAQILEQGIFRIKNLQTQSYLISMKNICNKFETAFDFRRGHVLVVLSLTATKETGSMGCEIESRLGIWWQL
jgi:hypothetical protein